MHRTGVVCCKRKKEHLNLAHKPILFKIAPDLDEEQIRDIALMSLANEIDGLVISNSSTDRPSSLISRNKNEIGGLSGKPLYIKSTLVLKKMYTLTNGQIPLIGVGGISNGTEFYEKINSKTIALLLLVLPLAELSDPKGRS